VARLNGRPRESRPRTDRGQFLLLGAFGVAVLLLVLAGVANTVAYTETLATHDDARPTSRDVSAFQEDAQRGVVGILERVNDGSGDHDTKVSRFDRSVDNWQRGADREHLADATGIDVTVQETTNESRITQSSDRELTNAGGNENWQLAREIEQTRSFELRLDRRSLTDRSCSSNECFELIVDGRTVSVSQSEITGPTSDDCDVDSDPVTIDVVDGTVNGEVCEALDVIETAEDGSDSYEIEYRNGENATGTYRLTVREATVEENNYGPAPSVTHVIYSAEIAASYRTPRLTYTNESIPVAEDDPYA